MAYKCPLCGKTNQLKQEMIEHIEHNHAEDIPKDMPTAQYLYLESHDGKAGVCRYCGKPTEWVDNLGKYRQVCESPLCKQKVRKQYEERMMKSYGKINLAQDPELQKKMLANKKISGIYKWSDGRHKFTYTGTYEKNIIEWLDKIMGVDPETIQMPGLVIDYELNGEKHFWITDLYLTDYNLVIEVKDGMENTHPGFEPNRIKEKAKDDYMRTQTKYNYLKLTHKNPLQLIKILSEIRMNNILGEDDSNKVLIQINEATSTESVKQKVTISKITKDDIEDCRATLKKVFGVDSLGKNTRSMYKIINENNEVVGYLGLSRYGTAIGIGNFAIKPEYRGHGYGTMVINKLRDTHKGLVYCFVDEKNTKAIQLYERLGTVHRDQKNKNNEYYVTFDKKKEVIEESAYANISNEEFYAISEAILNEYNDTVATQNLNTVMDTKKEEDQTPRELSIVEKLIKKLNINEDDLLFDGYGEHDVQRGSITPGNIDQPVESKNEEGGELRTDVDADISNNTDFASGNLTRIAHNVLNGSLIDRN